MVKYYKELLDEIKKLYDKSLSPEFDDKTFRHILDVTSEAEYICKLVQHPYTNVIELACLFHDVGLRDGRKNHHLNGIKYLREFIKEHNIRLSHEDEYKVIMAINQHRIGYKPSIDGYFPIISQIVSAADRGIIKLKDEEAYKFICHKLVAHIRNNGVKDMNTIHKSVYMYMQQVYGKNGVAYNNPIIKKYKGNTLPNLIDEKINSSNFKKSLEIYSKEYDIRWNTK